MVRVLGVKRAEGGRQPVPQQPPPVQVGVELGQVRAQRGRGRLWVARVKQRLDLGEPQAGLAQRQGPVQPGDLARAVPAVPGCGCETRCPLVTKWRCEKSPGVSRYGSTGRSSA